MLTTIADHGHSTRAFEEMKRALRKRGKRYRSIVGWRGGQDKVEVIWMKEEGIWSCLKPIETRYWCGFGLDNPKSLSRLNIAVEINPPLEGVNLRNGGMFALDEAGEVHLCHTGAIGGGGEGVGMAAFWERYRGNSETVHIPTRNRSIPVVDLGPVTSKMFPSRIALFTQEVARIKKGISDGDPIQTFPDVGGFTPEFSGKRSGYSPKKSIEAMANHGLVVNALAAAIIKAGHEIGNDQQRDMFIVHRGKEKKRGTARLTLFEVKTDVSSTSIYQGVGQLMMNGLARESQTNLILVVPGEPTPETEDGLKKLGIDILSYKWSGNKPKFTNLDDVLP